MSENIKTKSKEVFDVLLQRHENPQSKNARDRSPIISEAVNDDSYILDEIAKLPDLSELYCEDEEDTSICTFDYTEKNDETSKSDVYHRNLQRNRLKLFTDMQTTSAQEPSQTKYDISHLLKYNTLSNNSTQLDNSRHITILIRQRDNCKKSATVLKNKLKALKLHSKSNKSPSTDKLVKNNNKLQLDLHNKLKATGNVIKLLDEIIEAECSEAYNPEIKDSTQAHKQYKYNYEYYDPELHWCRICNMFPQTAKDFLKHLHTSLHQEKSADHIEKPWSEETGFDEGFPHVPSAPSKRTPIKGLQFYVPSTAWYCKLCKHFMGDEQSASNHLKSIIHANKYNEFIEHNPHFETDWISDRQKAYEKFRNFNRLIENEKIVSICISSDSDSEPTPKKEKSMKEKRRNKPGKENILKTNLEKLAEIDSTRSRQVTFTSDRVDRSVPHEIDDNERRRLESRWKDKDSDRESRMNEREKYADDRERCTYVRSVSREVDDNERRRLESRWKDKDSDRESRINEREKYADDRDRCTYVRSVSREVDDNERRRLESRWKDKDSEGERRMNKRGKYSDDREGCVYVRSVSREVDDIERRRLEARWKDKDSKEESRMNDRERHQEKSKLCYNERERQRDEEDRERRHRQDSRYKHRYRRDSRDRDRLRETPRTKTKFKENYAKMLPEPEKEGKPKLNMQELNKTATDLCNRKRKKNENIYQLAATWLNNNPLPIYPSIAVPDVDINQYYPYGYPYYMGTGYGLDTMMNPGMIPPFTVNSGTSLLGEPPIYYEFNKTFSHLYNSMNQESKTMINIISQNSNEQMEQENETCKQEGNEEEKNGIEDNSIVQKNLEGIRDESQTVKDLQEQPPNDEKNIDVQPSDNNQNASIQP
ncbi:zinc finger matrin-type protein CG9776 [Pieris rapae]|uniref:zinc finger matrin-type protein CG9776 n=1 Tax=Pieris rapae TaxID=64459 RepID=UPI001E27C5B1|nr:zinc finger matrin-type protein CG9776 [Pieris rapae]